MMESSERKREGKKEGKKERKKERKREREKERMNYTRELINRTYRITSYTFHYESGYDD